MIRIHLRHSLFMSLRECKVALIDLEIVPEEISCIKCNQNSGLTLYKNKSMERLLYRCRNSQCRHKRSLINSKMSINDYLLVIYKLIKGDKYKDITSETGATRPTILVIRKKLRESYIKYMSNKISLVGGVGSTVQCDETVLCRRGTIRNPTSTDDNKKETTWIVGCIDDCEPQNFFVQKVDNRKEVTLTNALGGKVCVGSKFYTDGHPSYPGVAKNLHLHHKIVNHSIGFTTSDGTHTNGIEGFWAILKDKMRKEHGVKRLNIDDWLKEFTFWRRYVDGKEDMEVSAIFIEILRLLLNLF